MMKSNPGKKSNIIWDIFSSVKLTLALLIILAVTSIAGTVIPQREGAVEFAQKLSPALVQLLNSLQLFDIYHSLWFRIMIALLSLNLIVCSMKRFQVTLKLFQALPRPDRSKPFENLPPQKSFRVRGEIQDVTRRVAAFMRDQYKKIEAKDTKKGNFFYGSKGRYSLFGVFVVHLSVLIILMGAIIGSIWGFEAYVNIAEGESVDMVTLRKRRGHAHEKLGFSVQCDKFTVDFYDTGAPKEFRSDLIFMDDGKVLQKGSLLVNHPITFRGITFYQSGYGTIPGDRVRLKISSSQGEPETLEIEKAHPMPLPHNEGQFEVVEVHGNLKGMMGPAALISIKPKKGKERHFWIFRNFESLQKKFPKAMFQSPILNPSAFKPYTFYLEEIQSKYYTGLQVNKDPGVPLVWVGFFMIVMGLFITFFTSHRRVWVRVLEEKGKIRISVSGKANKNPVGMERELDHLIHKLEDLLATER